MIIHWLHRKIKEDYARKLRCSCGIHVYKWNWRHLGFECIYCKKRRQK